MSTKPDFYILTLQVASRHQTGESALSSFVFPTYDAYIDAFRRAKAAAAQNPDTILHISGNDVTYASEANEFDCLIEDVNDGVYTLPPSDAEFDDVIPL